jgi:hypothetical protein
VMPRKYFPSRVNFNRRGGRNRRSSFSQAFFGSGRRREL